MYDIDNKVVDFIITNIDIKKKILIFDRDKTRKNFVYFLEVILLFFLFTAFKSMASIRMLR
jgi:hypothetical protein